MRKRKKGRKFSRERDVRKALIRCLAQELYWRGKIKTTLAKAKEIRPLVEKFITKAKKNNLTAKRFLTRYLSQKVVKKLIEEIAPRYKERNGGYTRIIKLGLRKSDGAKMAIIELIK